MGRPQNTMWTRCSPGKWLKSNAYPNLHGNIGSSFKEGVDSLLKIYGEAKQKGGYNIRIIAGKETLNEIERRRQEIYREKQP